MICGILEFRLSLRGGIIKLGPDYPFGERLFIHLTRDLAVGPIFHESECKDVSIAWLVRSFLPGEGLHTCYMGSFSLGEDSFFLHRRKTLD